MERYDTLVVGSGPAGLASAINLTIRKKRFLIFGTDRLSAKVELSPRIDNYLGFPEITGPQLVARFKDHLSQMGIEITPEQVTAVYSMGEYFSLTTAKNEYQATTVILATGAAPSALLPGEERLLGRGVSYCATCDAPLYRGKTVAVLGWSEEGAMEANFLCEIAKTVYYLPVKPHDAPLREEVIVLKESAREILGTGRVEALKTSGQALPVDGVFILRDTMPPSSLAPGIALKNNCPLVDWDMQTSLPGLFAAGDITGKPYQLMRATGQGQTAALAATAYLAKFSM